MPARRAKQETGPKMILGIGGGAEISEENLNALLDDTTGDLESEEVKVYIAVQRAPSDAALFAAAWCRDAGVPYVAFTEGGKTSKDVKEITDGAAKTETANDVYDALVNALKNETGDVRLLNAYDGDEDDSEDNESYTLLEKAEDAGLKSFNLVRGLDALSFDDDPSPEEPQPEPEREAEGEIKGDPPVDYATAADYPLRKLRAYALGKVDNGNTMSKDELLGALFPDEHATTAAEPEKPARAAKKTAARKTTPAAPEPGPEAVEALEEEALDPENLPPTFIPRTGKWVTDAEAMEALVLLQTYLGQAGKNPPGRPRKDGIPAGQTKKKDDPEGE